MFEFDEAPEAIIINDPNAEEPELEEGTEEPDVEDGEVEIEDHNAEDGSTEEEEQEGETPENGTEGQAGQNWQQKFKTPEEMYDAFSRLEQSYNNLRPEFTRKSQELAELKKKTVPDAGQELPTEIKTPEDAVALIKAAVRMETEQAVAPYKERAEMLEMESALNKLARNHNDFDALLPDTMKILEQRPYLWEGGSEDALLAAYSIAKSTSINKSVEAIVEKTLSDKDKITAIKQKNSLRTKASQQTQTKATSEEEDIAESILNVTKAKANIFF